MIDFNTCKAPVLHANNRKNKSLMKRIYIYIYIYDKLIIKQKILFWLSCHVWLCRTFFFFRCCRNNVTVTLERIQEYFLKWCCFWCSSQVTVVQDAFSLWVRRQRNASAKKKKKIWVSPLSMRSIQDYVASSLYFLPTVRTTAGWMSPQLGSQLSRLVPRSLNSEGKIGRGSY